MSLSDQQLDQVTKMWLCEMREHAKSLPIFKDMNERLRNLCWRSQLYSMSLLTGQTRSGLLAKNGWGVVSVNELEKLLAKYGKKLKKDKKTKCKECGQWR